jgi:FlgD Ig-like domain
MAPEPSRGFRLLAVGLAMIACMLNAPAAQALRIMDYNVTNYPSVLFPARQPYFRIIYAPIHADIFVGQEFRTQAGVDSFVTNVLNVDEPGQWVAAPFFDGNDTDNALFYKPAKLQLLGAWAFYPDPPTNLRLVSVWRLKPVGYSSDQAEFRIYSQHLKASTGFESQRLTEAIGIRDSMNAMPPGTHAIVLGDWNFYNSSTEPAYGKVQESQTNNIGRVYDPLNPTLAVQNWHNNAAFVNIHTQCPCVTCPTGSGFSGGGLDDRFDQILPTLNWNTGQGLALLPATYTVIGQDGHHFNLNITDAPTIPEGATYANALWNASDHLPSRVDFQIPAQIGPVSALSFGSVILGATALQNAAISDTAQAPADSLRFTLVAPAGFIAPAGPLAVAAGQTLNPAIQIDATSVGIKSGNLQILSNDLDFGTTSAALSGTVLAHAVPSLDSLTVVAADSVDFGTQPAGGFTGHDIRLHDFGYNALQAQLAMNAATFAGGDGRFSIAGGFTASLLAGTGETWTLAFNDAGATADSEYTGTLTFSSTDEPLPGAAPAPDLVLSLKAQLSSGTLAAPPSIASLPQFTRLYAPFPNPFSGTSTVRFDLAHTIDLRLEVFDLSGRRVTTLANREMEPGRYSLSWDGRGDSGAPLGPGLYFVRMSGAGLRSQTARIAIVH